MASNWTEAERLRRIKKVSYRELGVFANCSGEFVRLLLAGERTSPRALSKVKHYLGAPDD